MRDLVTERTVLVDTDGVRVGQVNGLVFSSTADRAFGRPVRVTARTHAGSAGVVNIEREAALGGSLYTKGVLILTGFLGGHFALEAPLALTATVTLEQSYTPIDGDSASSTELYALLSSLSGIPLRQDIAVTGSINQNGEIQPIGGVNLKIEGFYDVCRARGLTGTQGVMIPAQNMRDLMLRHDVVDAVRRGHFHIYAVSRIEEGIELLTGKKAGKHIRNRFTPGSIYAIADRRLRTLYQSQKKAGGQ